MSSLPRFAQFPKNRSKITKTAISGINTTTPGNLVEIFKTGENGGIAVAASVMPLGTMSAASVLLYGSVDNGATKYPLRSVVAPAYTNSTTAERPTTFFKGVDIENPIQLEPGMIVYGGSEVVVADGISIEVEYQEFSAFKEAGDNV